MPSTSWSLTPNAVTVLESRYLQRDDRGSLDETPTALRERVAAAVAKGEESFGGKKAVDHWREKFDALLEAWNFLPNSPTLMNAGTRMGQLSACFVLPIEDSIESIFDTLKLMALIQQSGGGTGFSFSRLRAKGEAVSTTGGKASGPVSFLRIFDSATDHIRQGGRRRGANMGILRADHPDILEFIEAKLDLSAFRNFNFSVGVPDAVMQAMITDDKVKLRDPSTKKVVKEIGGAHLLDRIAEAAWKCGDPGLVFLDTINKANPTPSLGEIEATNPCGEVPLLPYEACNLGSINLSRMARAKEVDWEKLADVTRTSVRFLDDVIEIGRFPDKRIEKIVRGNRKIGLGVMGFAELLIQLNLAYASSEAATLGASLMKFIDEKARLASAELAKERGNFPNWKDSKHGRENVAMRNATVTSVAPTGTLSLIANTSPGIEPLFALAFHRNVLDGKKLHEVNPLFLDHAKKSGLATEPFLKSLYATGNLSTLEVPDDTRRLFRTALEMTPEDHLRIQVAFQKHTDNAVSKTINLPESATAQTVSGIYRRAFELGLKGITVFRQGSRGEQVLELGTSDLPPQSYFTCEPECGV